MSIVWPVQYSNTRFTTTNNTSFFYRIAYSVFSLQHQLDNSNENSTIKVMYDIACTLNAHLKVSDETNVQ